MRDRIKRLAKCPVRAVFVEDRLVLLRQEKREMPGICGEPCAEWQVPCGISHEPVVGSETGGSESMFVIDADRREHLLDGL